MIGRPVVNDEGYIDHAYLPSYMHAQKRDYARSFGVQIYTGIRRTTGWAREVPGFGVVLQAGRQAALSGIRQLPMLWRNDPQPAELYCIGQIIGKTSSACTR